MFSWVSPSLREQHGRITIRKIAGSAVCRVRNWIEAMSDRAQSLPSFLRSVTGVTQVEEFTPAFVFPNCLSTLSTEDDLRHLMSAPFTDESGSGDSVATSLGSHSAS